MVVKNCPPRFLHWGAVSSSLGDYVAVCRRAFTRKELKSAGREISKELQFEWDAGNFLKKAYWVETEGGASFKETRSVRTAWSEIEQLAPAIQRQLREKALASAAEAFSNASFN